MSVWVAAGWVRYYKAILFPGTRKWYSVEERVYGLPCNNRTNSVSFSSLLPVLWPFSFSTFLLLCMYMYMHLRVCISIIYVYMCVWFRVCMHICVCMCIHVYVYAYICTFLYVYVMCNYICVWVYTNICLRVICVCMYTYISLHMYAESQWFATFITRLITINGLLDARSLWTFLLEVMRPSTAGPVFLVSWRKIVSQSLAMYRWDLQPTSELQNRTELLSPSQSHANVT